MDSGEELKETPYGELSWMDATDNDRVLVREHDIPGLTENPITELCVLTTTLNHDFIKVCEPSNMKSHWWIQSSQYELIEILPPQLPSN